MKKKKGITMASNMTNNRQCCLYLSSINGHAAPLSVLVSLKLWIHRVIQLYFYNMLTVLIKELKREFFL